jgi:CRP/FNR family transcriptional regulator
MARIPPTVRCQGRSNCFDCTLRHEMVCSEVTLDELIDFHTGIEDFDYGHGAALFTLGTPTEGVYCVRHGAVKMVKQDPSGGQRIVRVLKRGDVAGIESAFSDRYEHTAIAVGEVRACRVPIEYFRNFVATHGNLQMRLLRTSQDTLRETESWLSELTVGSLPARTRMARLLLRLRVTDDGDRIHRFGIEDMAAILGIAQETVSRAISDFVREGILVKGGKTFATRYFRGDLPALEKIARED